MYLASLVDGVASGGMMIRACKSC